MRKTLLFALINLVVLGSLTAPVVTGLPLAIASIAPGDDRTASLAFVTISGAVASVIANPLFGFLSDRTPGRFGRRRPWMLGGVLAGLGGTVLVVQAESVAALAIAWVITQTAYNASLAAVAAMLGDQITERRRASASGTFAAAAFLGTLPPLALAAFVPSQIQLVMLTMPIAAVVVVVACCIVLTDTALPKRLRTVRSPRLATTGRIRRAAPLFPVVWIQRFLVQFAFSLATSFTLFFVVDRFRATPEQAASTVAITTLVGGAAIVISAVGAGFIAARHGNYGPFLVVAAVGLGAAAVVRSTSVAPTGLWIGAAIGGIALGAFYAVDLALALRTIPASDSGGYLGVLNVAETLPQTIAPAVAVALLATGGADPFSGGTDNYATLYLVAGAVALLALTLIVFLRPALSRVLLEQADSLASQQPETLLQARS